MFKSKLEALIVVIMLLAIPPCSWLVANNIHPAKAEVETSAKR